MVITPEAGDLMATGIEELEMGDFEVLYEQERHRRPRSRWLRMLRAVKWALVLFVAIGIMRVMYMLSELSGTVGLCLFSVNLIRLIDRVPSYIE